MTKNDKTADDDRPHADGWFGAETATFGDRLAGAREAAGMSRGQLAKRLGVKKSSLTEWEDDLSEPRANRLSMLAGLLNVSIMWLLTGEGDGIASPDDEPAVSPDCREALTELAAVRAEIAASVDRLARLEAKLRKVMATERGA